MSLYFRDRGIIATQKLQDDSSKGKSVWQVNGFADLDSYDNSLDRKRVRNFKNNLCLSMDKQEALNYDNLGLNFVSITPDDHPVVGHIRQFQNVYINGGHGQRINGMAFATAKYTSDLIEGVEVG